MKPWEKREGQPTSLSGPWEKYAEASGVDDGQFSASTMVRNIPGSMGQLVSDFTFPFRHPVQTYSAMRDLVKGVGDKMGIDLDDKDQSQHVDAVASFLKKRYGSWDAFTNSLEQDPAGVVSDVAGVLSMGTGLAAKAPGNVGKVASTANRVVSRMEPIAGTAAAVHSASRLIPESAPRSLYKSAAKFNTKQNVDPNTLADTAIKHRVMPSTKGLEGLNELIGDLGARIDEIVETGGAAGVEIPVQSVLSALDDLKASKKGFTPDGPEATDFIERQKAALLEHMAQDGPPRSTITPEELLEFRRAADKNVNYYRKGGTESGPVREQYNKTLADSARGELAEAVPEIAEVNREIGPAIELRDALEKKVPVIERRNNVSFGQQTGTASGAVAGDVMGMPLLGAILGYTAASMQRPKIQARLAMILDGVRKGDMKVLNGLTNAQANAVMSNVGRLSEDANRAPATTQWASRPE